MPQHLDVIVASGPTSGLVKPVMSPKAKLAVCLGALIVLCTDVEAGNSVASMTFSAIVRNACAASTLAHGQEMKAVASIGATGEISMECARDVSAGSP